MMMAMKGAIDLLYIRMGRNMLVRWVQGGRNG